MVIWLYCYTVILLLGVNYLVFVSKVIIRGMISYKNTKTQNPTKGSLSAIWRFSVLIARFFVIYRQTHLAIKPYNNLAILFCPLLRHN